MATVAFLLLLDTSLLSQAGITHYSQLLTLQHSTELLFVCFFLSRSKLIFKVPTTTWGVPPDYILTNLFINCMIIGCQCRQEMPNFTDSKWLKTPKTDRALKVPQEKEVYQLAFQVCRPWNHKVPCHLKYCIYCASAPPLQRESTDFLMYSHCVIIQLLPVFGLHGREKTKCSREITD